MVASPEKQEGRHYDIDVNQMEVIGNNQNSSKQMNNKGQ